MADESRGQPSRWRRLSTDLATFVVCIYGVALPLSFGLGWLSEQGDAARLASVSVSVVGFLLLAVSVFMWLAYEEDWWDDFREQNRAMVLFGVLHLGGLPTAWFLGRTFGG